MQLAVFISGIFHHPRVRTYRECCSLPVIAKNCPLKMSLQFLQLLSS